MAAASFLATQVTLLGRAGAPSGARGLRRAPCVTRAGFVPRHETAARFATCASRTRVANPSVAGLSLNARGFQTRVTTGASGEDSASSEVESPHENAGVGAAAAEGASDSSQVPPPPHGDAASGDAIVAVADESVAADDDRVAHDDERTDATAGDCEDETNPADDAPPTWSQLGLPNKLCAALKATGFKEPSLPQVAAIPALLAGTNVALQSHTGSGKTMAYLLPVIAKVLEEESLPANERSSDVRCLVVVPSQELAMQIVRQVERVLGEYGKSITQQCIGGANVRRQEESLRKKKPLLVIGTPGRLAELSRNGILRTHGVKCLVIDEADDLLASNFRRDMARICDHTGKGVLGGRQTVIVSATLKRETLTQYEYMAPGLKQIVADKTAGKVHDVRDDAKRLEDNDDIERSSASAALPKNLEHYVVVADSRHKVDRLRSAIHATGAQRALVFLNFGHRLADVRDKLATRGMNCGVLHGGMNKMERASELAAFRRGDFRALLVSDLAARGIDVPEIDAVFNLELPTDATHYVHRAGRTGRMGAEGFVLTICELREAHVMPKIAKALGVAIRAADLQKGNLVPDRGDRPGESRQNRERVGAEGGERKQERVGDERRRTEREKEPRRERGDARSDNRGEGERGRGGRGGGGGRGAGRGDATASGKPPGAYTPKGQPRRRTKNA